MYTAKDYDRALLSPSSVFDRPMDVVSTDSMTVNQKMEVLKRWEAEAHDLEVADGEAMCGGEPSRLPDVRVAIDILCDREAVSEQHQAA